MGLLIASLVLMGLTLIGVIVGRVAYVYIKEIDFDNTQSRIDEAIKAIAKPEPTKDFRYWFQIKEHENDEVYCRYSMEGRDVFGGARMKMLSWNELSNKHGEEYKKYCKENEAKIKQYEEKVKETKEKIIASSYGSGKTKKNKYIWGTVGYSLLSACWLVILLFGAFCKVSGNEVGIIYDDRYGVMEHVKYEGFQMKSVFEHITTISTANRSAMVTTTGQTSDGQYATFELSLIYRVDRDNAGKFYKKANGSEMPTEALDTIVKSDLQSATINYNIFDLLSVDLETARLDFKDRLATDLLGEYFVTLVDVSFDDVDAGTQVEDILKSKAEATQRIDIAQRQAQADLITAENKAEIERTLADAEAYALKTVGGAKGEAEQAYVEKVKGMIDNLSQNSTLTYKECTDIVLGIVFYDTWDGKLPEVLTSDSLSGMIGGLISNNP